MLSDCERRFIEACVATDDPEEHVRLWRECGCAGDSDQSVKQRMSRLLARSDARLAMESARRRRRIRERQAERQLAELAVQDAEMDKELYRTAKEQLLDALVTVGRDVAGGNTSRAAALSKLVDMVPKIVSGTPVTVPEMTTEEARRQMGIAPKADAPPAAPEEPEEDEEDDAPGDIVAIIDVNRLPVAGTA